MGAHLSNAEQTPRQFSSDCANAKNTRAFTYRHYILDLFDICLGIFAALQVFRFGQLQQFFINLQLLVTFRIFSALQLFAASCNISYFCSFLQLCAAFLQLFAALCSFFQLFSAFFSFFQLFVALCSSLQLFEDFTSLQFFAAFSTCIC